MRLANLIRFGTEHYPEKTARRLRGVTISCWLGALVTGGTTLSPLTPGLWKAHLIDGVAALVFMLAPLLHRWSSLAAPIVAILTAYTLIFAVTIFYGSGSGIYHFYQLFAPLVILAVGVEHIRLAFGLVVLGIVMAIAAKVVAPVDSGVLSTTLQFYDDTIVFIVAGSLIQFLIVLYAFRQVERSEAVAEREAERADAANKHKSHLVASASHDLRQPLHALNLFVARLRNEPDPVERNRLVTRIDASVASMNELFESLLDMTKLEAGIVNPQVAALPIRGLLARIETTFGEAAHKKGLDLRVVSSRAWVMSDPILLERILLNLVANAVRYTEQGGIVLGCRRQGSTLRIDVCDTGPGIPEDQRHNIFGEFYQLPQSGRARREGLGLGLAIVDRLSRLLGHRVEVVSRSGHGSRFSVLVPLTAQPAAETETRTSAPADPAHGKRLIVIDDDELVLDGMRGILQSWGCHVQTAASGAAALAELADDGIRPDLIICDSRLADGRTGIEAIERLREALGAPVPAFLITGDTAPERLREASAGGFLLLHKPVSAMALRTTLNRLLKAHEAPVASPRAGSRR